MHLATTATDCFVFGYHYHCYVIHICNIEQFENKVTYLLVHMAYRATMTLICNISIMIG